MSGWEFLSIFPLPFSINTREASDFFWHEEKKSEHPRYLFINMISTNPEFCFEFKFSETYKVEQKSLYQKRADEGLINIERANEIMGIFNLMYFVTLKNQGVMIIRFQLPDEWNEGRTKMAIEELKFQLYHFSSNFLKRIEKYENISASVEYERNYTILTKADKSMEEFLNMSNDLLKNLFRDLRNLIGVRIDNFRIKIFGSLNSLFFPFIIILAGPMFSNIGELYRYSTFLKNIKIKFEKVLYIYDIEPKMTVYSLNYIESLAINLEKNSNIIMNALSAQVTITNIWIGIVGFTSAFLIYNEIRYYLGFILFIEIISLFKSHTKEVIEAALDSMEYDWGEINQLDE